MLLVPFVNMHAQSTVEEGQSTEGNDFWFTFMQADQKKSKDAPISYEGQTYNALELSMSISSRENCRVYIENPYTGYLDSVDVTADERKLVHLYSGVPVNAGAREAMKDTLCYSYQSEKVDTTALHVWSTKDISLFATNYKRATFDATNVLPKASLQDEYIIQTYTPSDHEGGTQGSHFAIVAVEDNTVATYILSANTMSHIKGDTVTTPALKAGQVWYVWTGNGEGDAADLSGTKVKANKKIAVFQGCPHTNIPYKVKERDHIFSQAMPVQYWGNTFVLTSSGGRKRDFVRIMAQEDGTTVYINGDSVYTFDFEKSPKQYWEFEFGKKDVKGGDKEKESDLTPRPEPTVVGDSCYITTSCPSAVHLFTASRQWDGNKKNNGDPSMLWVNPIEQQIDKVTFATYDSNNGTSSHYVNIVTDHPGSMYHHDTLMNASAFKRVSTSPYYYIQYYLGSKADSHTLRCEGGKFIAHVYGFTANESYGYSAGGATKELTQYITITDSEGKTHIFTPGSENTMCGDDTIRFACHPNYEYEKIEWYFGDGEKNLENKDSVPHEYKQTGVYEAQVLIYRNSSHVCGNQNVVDTIPITVTIGNYKVDVKRVFLPECTIAGSEVDFTIYLDNASKVDLTGDGVTIDFTKAAVEDGLTKDKLTVANDTTLVIHLPGTVKDDKTYGLHLHIDSDCPNSVLDKDLEFSMKFDKPYLTQRYNNVLGVLKDSFPNQTLSDFTWIRDNKDTLVNESMSVLYLEENESNNGEYKVCFNIHEDGKEDYNYCTCPVVFIANDKQHEFNPELSETSISATYAIKDNKVFVNADYKGQTDIECYAQWITTSGKVYNDLKFTIPNGGCTIPVPEQDDLYLLRVTTGKESRSFKFIINH